MAEHLRRRGEGMIEQDRELEGREQRLTDTVKRRGACLEEVENSTLTTSLKRSSLKTLHHNAK